MARPDPASVPPVAPAWMSGNVMVRPGPALPAEGAFRSYNVLFRPVKRFLRPGAARPLRKPGGGGGEGCGAGNPWRREIRASSGRCAGPAFHRLTAPARRSYRDGMDFAPDTYAIIGTILAVGFALAGMGWRMASRLDKRIGEDRAAADADRRAAQATAEADRRAAQTAADADRRAAQAAADADRRQWQASMDAFREEMLRLAERQSHIEGRIEAAG